MNCPGDDGEEIQYRSVEEMWAFEIGEGPGKFEGKNRQPIGSKESWYKGAVEYWDR